MNTELLFICVHPLRPAIIYACFFGYTLFLRVLRFFAVRPRLLPAPKGHTLQRVGNQLHLKAPLSIFCENGEGPGVRPGPALEGPAL